MSITVLGNVGNQGYALPMVSAFPINPNNQYLLAWNPTLQALDYVAYSGNSFGDFTAGRDLISTRDTIVGEDLSVVGNTVLGGTLGVTGIATFTQRPVFNGGVPALVSNGSVTGTGFLVGANQVVGARITGWAAATNTSSKATFDTAAVTLPQLAQRVKALIDDLITHGLIGV